MEETKELKETEVTDELTDKYAKAFEFVREIGFTKNYESMVGNFTMGIAMTKPPRPVGKEEFDEKIEELVKTRPYEFPDNLNWTLQSLVKEGDSLRYHRVYFNDIMVHYVFIKNASLAGRVDGIEDPAAVSKAIKINNMPDGADEKFKDIELVGMIVIGDKNPVITNQSRGQILDHEFAHIMLEFTRCHATEEQVAKLDEIKEDLGDKYPLFEEFLCDFIPYDSTVVNRFKVSPIAKFSDAMNEFFKDDVIEAYAPIVKAISPYYEAMTE